jgi:small subunit ribosomal protein S33
MSRALNKFTPKFVAAIAESSRVIFGNLPVVNYRTGYKILQQKPIGPLVMSHYPVDISKPFRGMLDNYQTEAEQRRTNALNKLKRKGKGPPKKGQGRRAGRKK